MKTGALFLMNQSQRHPWKDLQNLEFRGTRREGLQGWGAGETCNDEGEMAGDYAGYVHLNSQFKICPNASWDGAYGVGDDTPAGSMTVGDGLNNLTVSEPGYYYVKCNINDLTWSADVVNFGVIGSATPG